MTDLFARIKPIVADLAALRAVDRPGDVPGSNAAVAGDEASGSSGAGASTSLSVIKHFACTGGTLFSKCLASAPNTVVLSELQPESALRRQNRLKFSPSDLLYHLGLSQDRFGAEIVSRASIEVFREIDATAASRGLQVVIREHSHSKYCTGDSIHDWHGVGGLLSSIGVSRQVVTVRDPVESYLSIVRESWAQFRPATFDEYCRRYLAFVEDNADHRFFKYEDLCAQPQQFREFANESLGVEVPANFVDLFFAHELSGDSGTRLAEITPKPPRTLSKDFLEKLNASKHYSQLIERLDYGHRG